MKIDKKLLKNLDWLLLLNIFLLVGVGFVFITSATANPFTGEEMGLSQIWGNLDFYLVSLQLVWFASGLALMIVVCLIDYHVYGDLINIAYVALLAVLVMLIVLEKTINGASAWISVTETRGFQPSELFKIVVIIMMAKFAASSVEKNGSIKANRDFFKTMGFMALPTALVILQPDMGTAMVYICIVAGVLFAGRISWKVILVAVLLAVGMLAMVFFTPGMMEDYQKMRIVNSLGIETTPEVMDRLNIPPEAAEKYTNDNVDEAVSAITAGGVKGIGLFAPGSAVQLGYLYADHTDFIFAAGVNATGFIGGLVVIALYFTLIMRSLFLASRAKDYFGSFVIIGVVFMELAHIVENIAMNMGVLPVTGIPLPFISYGGSSMWTNMIAFALVLNIGMRRPSKRHSNTLIQ